MSHGQSVSARAHAVYVHGLWLNGAESLILRRRVQRELGMPVHSFRYKSVSSSMAEVVARLQTFVSRLEPTTLHFIGHSFGGLVIYRFLEKFPDQPPGRVVFLGTPAVASRAALAAAERVTWARSALGVCIGEELLTRRARAWAVPGRDLGVIAGTRNVGLGQFFAQFDEECDGTVAVSETGIEGRKDQLILPVSHMGMIVSARVARETAAFLRDGHFSLGRWN